MFSSCSFKKVISLILSSLCVFYLLSACGGNSLNGYEKYTGGRTDPDNSTVRIGYSGRIDELPLIAAFEKGYFQDNGINAELVKINDTDVMSEYVTKRLDAVTADYRYFKYIEQGLLLKVTVGLTAGCIRLLVPNGSKIKEIEDLKGSRIGIEDLGDGTMVLSSMLFSGNGIDAGSEIRWKPYGKNGFMKAFENNDIDAACIWEPSEKASEFLKDKFRTLYTNAEQGTSGLKNGHSHGSGMHFTRTYAGISESLAVNYPEKAVYITKAWLQGANWVSGNNAAAAGLMTDKGFVTGSYEENFNTLSSYMWTNGVSASKLNIKNTIKEQKNNGVLKENLDENEFFKKVFAGILPEFY